MKTLSFVKMSGAGNDFVIIEPAARRDVRTLAQRICHRTSGIGADGLILLGNSKRADFRMRIINADGTEAEMCGNGVRCLASYIRRYKKIRKKHIAIDTKAGIILTQTTPSGARVRLSQPKDLKTNLPLNLNGGSLHIHYIDTGVPHVVIFVDNLKGLDVKTIGRPIRFHKKFTPRGANVNFVEQHGPGQIAVRTYERGVENETLACGTGSAAAALITHMLAAPHKDTQKDVCIHVHTAGGDILKIRFDSIGGCFKNVWLEGHTRLIAEGRYFLKS